MAPVDPVGPVGPVSVLGGVQALLWSASPEVVFISVIIFLVLGVVLLALCIKCHRTSGNAYDVKTAEGSTVATTPDDPGNVAYLQWRDHMNSGASAH